jgi:hypothetical protein
LGKIARHDCNTAIDLLPISLLSIGFKAPNPIEMAWTIAATRFYGYMERFWFGLRRPGAGLAIVLSEVRTPGKFPDRPLQDCTGQELPVLL